MNRPDFYNDFISKFPNKPQFEQYQMYVAELEKYTNYLEQKLNEPTTESDTSKANLNIPVVRCSACGKKIPEHEINVQQLASLTKSDIEDIECISCEMKYRDSADIDMFGV